MKTSRKAPRKRADVRGEQRARLIAIATEAVEEAGPEVLRARAIAAEAGLSTQALYTHFGGMPGLIEAVVADGFAGFVAHTGAVGETEDPVCDFLARGWSWIDWALSHPNLYRLMFGLTGGELRHHSGLEMAVAGTVGNSPQAQALLDLLVGSMQRVVDAKRIKSTDPVVPAAQCLSATHGWILLQLAGAFGPGDLGLRVITGMSLDLMVGLGDSRAAAKRSLRAAQATR
jgi:AcrR family transcriptional regulator